MRRLLSLVCCLLASEACGSGADAGPSAGTPPVPSASSNRAGTDQGHPGDGGTPGTLSDGGNVPEAQPDGSLTKTALSVSTIAGKNGNTPGFADGNGQKALFNFPEGAAIDPAGRYLYVADTNNHVIRKVDLTTNDVTTVAGTPERLGNADGHPGQLNLPRSLAIDAAGKNLYVTDTGNYSIRKIDLGTLAMSTLVGTAGTAGTSDGIGGAAHFGLASQQAYWAGGLAIDETTDPTNPAMYVADSANQTLRKVDLTTRSVTTIAGKAGAAGAVDGVGLAARFNKPNGRALDGSRKYLYLSESNAIDIRRIELASMKVTTAAGKAPADPRGVCDDSNPKPPFPPECDSTDGAGPDARFRTPFGLTTDNVDALYIVDAHNDLVRKMSFSTDRVSTVAGVQRTITDDNPHASNDSTPTQAGTFWHPTHAVFQAPNILYVIDRGASCVRRVVLASP